MPWQALFTCVQVCSQAEPLGPGSFGAEGLPWPPYPIICCPVSSAWRRQALTPENSDLTWTLNTLLSTGHLFPHGMNLFLLARQSMIHAAARDVF